VGKIVSVQNSIARLPDARTIQAPFAGLPTGGEDYAFFGDGFGVDGALGSDWTGPTWTVAGGKVTNTPALGAERLSNVEFTADLTGWGAGDGATITRRDYAVSPNIAPTGGSDNYGIEVQSGGNINSNGLQNAATVAGNWYRFSARTYSPSSNTGTVAAGLGSSNIIGMVGYYRIPSEDSWQTLVMAGRASSGSCGVQLRCVSATVGDKAHLDATSTKEIQLADTFATIGNCKSDIDISVKITRSTRASAGLVLCLDNARAPINFVVVYLDPGTGLTVDKCVNGTYTNVLPSTPIAYSAGAVLRVVKSGTSITMYYNGLQVGVPQSVSDNTIISNTRHGMFSTDSTVSLDDFNLDAKRIGEGDPLPTGLSVTIPQYLTGYAGVMFTFDDAEMSIYNLAYSILDAKRGRGTFYITTERVGTGAYITWPQLLILQGEGWTIGNHTRTHANLTLLSQAEATIEIDNGEADLNAQGITGKTHLAYPGGAYNGTVIAAAGDAGMVTGRTIDGGNIDLAPGYNLFTIKLGQNIIAATAMETVKNIIDAALRDKVVVAFLIHSMPGDCSAANLTELVGYVADRYIPMLTIDDLYDAMSGEITVAIGP